MRRFLVLFALLGMAIFTYGSALSAQDAPAPAPADSLVKSACKKAKPKKSKTEKTVFVIFHASWCGWCKRLEAALDDKEVRKAMETSYKFVRLDVQEHGDKVSLENPGGNKMMEDWGGAKAGLPFYVFLDSSGKKLADSLVMPNNMNIGYPGSADEITEFENLLKKTAPNMADADRATVIAYFKDHAPKQ